MSGRWLAREGWGGGLNPPGILQGRRLTGERWLASLGLTGLYHRTSLSHSGVPGGDRGDGWGEDGVGQGAAGLIMLCSQEAGRQDVVLVVVGGRGQQRQRVVVGRVVIILAASSSTESVAVSCSCLVVSLPGIGVHYVSAGGRRLHITLTVSQCCQDQILKH